MTLLLMFLDLKKFLDDCYDKTAQTQADIEQKFLESEQLSVSCSKPPKKKKKLNSSKQGDMAHAMASLAAQLQLNHFKQVSISCYIVSSLHDTLFSLFPLVFI